MLNCIYTWVKKIQASFEWQHKNVYSFSNIPIYSLDKAVQFASNTLFESTLIPILLACTSMFYMTLIH